MRTPPNSSRRAALAGGAAAILLPGLARPTGTDDDRLCCGGNGPPNKQKNGTGTTVSSALSDTQQVQFSCPKSGFKGEPTNTFLFVPETGVTVVSYTGPGGHALTSYTDVAGFTGIVFVIEPSYILRLQWPFGIPPLASVRFANSAESNA